MLKNFLKIILKFKVFLLARLLMQSD